MISFPFSKYPEQILVGVGIDFEGEFASGETVASYSIDDAGTNIATNKRKNGTEVLADLAGGQAGQRVDITYRATGSLGSQSSAIIALIITPATTNRRTISNIGQPLVAPDGTALSGVKITFRLTDGIAPADTFDAITGERVASADISVVTDSKGEFTVSLWPTSRGQNQRVYLCTVNWPSVHSFTAPLPEGSEVLSWADFKSAGATIQPADLPAFAKHTLDVSVHLSPPHKAAMDAANHPTGQNPFATLADVQTANGTAPATTSSMGIVRLSFPPSDSSAPEAMAANDPRVVKSVNGTTPDSAGNVQVPAAGGDMAKEIYDPDHDGKVLASESADAVPWEGVSGKPLVYPPESHDHAAADIVSDPYHRFVTEEEIAEWNAKASTAVATSSSNGLMSKNDKEKLDGVAPGANNYSHPAMHPASMIVEDDARQFASVEEKTTWNNKADGPHTHSYQTLNGLPTFKTIEYQSITGDGNIPLPKQLPKFRVYNIDYFNLARGTDLADILAKSKSDIDATVQANRPVNSAYDYVCTFDGTYAGTDGNVGGVLLPDGRVLCIPHVNTSLRIYDPINNAVKVLTPTSPSLPGQYAYAGGVLMADGRVFFVPYGTTSARVFNPTTDELTIPNVTFPGNDGHYGGVLLPDGRVFCCPFYATQAKIYDPASDTLANANGTYPGAGALCGCVLLRDGRVYCVPRSGTAARIYDPVSDTTSIPNGTFPGTASAFAGGVLMADGRVFIVPRNSTTARIYDPVTDSLITPNGTYPGNNAFTSGVLLPDGRVFCSPYSSTTSAVYDPVADEVTVPRGTYPGAGSYCGSVLLGDGRVFCVPQSATVAKGLSGVFAAGQPFEGYTSLSPYLNKW